MSWQSYIDTMVSAPGSVVKNGAIIGLDGSIWAKSPSLNASQDEIRKLVAGFHKPSQFLEGIHFNATAYHYIRNTDRSLVGKLGEQGLFASKCGKCIVVALFVGAPQLASVAVEPLADYLVQVGF